jgi:hypothetical protein
MASTLSQLITRVQERISQAAGSGIQIYAEDRVAEMIWHKFETIFDTRFWPDYSTWETMTLDGTLGVVTTDLTDKIKRFEDIGIIYPEDSDTPLTRVTPFSMNPNNIGGTSARVYESYMATDTSKVFRVWPRASTGNLEVFYRTKPDQFVAEDEILFDEQALILGAAWDYLEDDGTNPNASSKMERLYLDRVDQISKNLDNDPIALDHHAGRPSTFEFTALS